MQNNFITDAINLKSYSLSESDKIIVMYSKDKGLIKGVAKGVKKPKSKLGARMDLLVANTLMLHKGRNLDTICQADVLNNFNKTRQNLDKIFYSMYVAEVVNNFGTEEDPGQAPGPAGSGSGLPDSGRGHPRSLRRRGPAAEAGLGDGPNPGGRGLRV